jgi:hypothetical protein
MPTPQLSLFAHASPVPPDAVWVHATLFERTERAPYVHLVRHPSDPERSPRPPGGVADKQPHQTLAKTSFRDWVHPIRTLLSDDLPRTFNRIAVELLDKTADIVFQSPFDEALWWLVDQGELEHTLEAPVFFRRIPARLAVCAPCRDAHGHFEHHVGVWARADGSDPVLCSCPLCTYRPRQSTPLQAARAALVEPDAILEGEDVDDDAFESDDWRDGAADGDGE